MICGYPSSGKTMIVEQLMNYLIKNDKIVEIISEDSLLINKNESYKDSKEEIFTRGKIKAAVERMLSREVVVIVDSLNYIKGFRYELYCISRSVGTPSCLVYSNVERNKTFEWNQLKDQDKRWDEKILEELINRFEVPMENRKWEKPLFTIDEERIIPLDDILTCCLSTYTKSVHAPTQHAKLSDTNYLYDLDKVTLDIIKSILEQQRVEDIGNLITVSHTDNKMKLNRVITMAELRRLRRQYVSIAKALTSTKTEYSDQTKEQIANSFIDYLTTNLSQ